MWFVYSILCAFFAGTRDFFVKASTRKGGNIYLIAAIVALSSGWIAYIIQVLTCVLQPSAFFNSRVLSVLLIIIPLEAAGAICYYLAIEASHLSLTLPFMTVTPVIVPIVSYFILGEGVTPVVYLGIVLVFIGGYLLFFESGKSIFEPIRKFAREKGSMLMFATGVIYSFTSVLGRKLTLIAGSANTSAYYYLITGLFIAAILMVMYFIKKRKQIPGKESVSLTNKSAGSVIGAAIASSLVIVTHFAAIGLVNAAYMISVKRMSALFGIIISAIAFKEKIPPLRYVAAIIMIAGVMLVAFIGTRL